MGQTIHALICLGYNETSIENFVVEITRNMENVSPKDALTIAGKFTNLIETEKN